MEQKLRSSETLFDTVATGTTAFHELLQKHFHGNPCQHTLRLLANSTNTKDNNI